jgi:membrane-associated phospholipid phosphatase
VRGSRGPLTLAAVSAIAFVVLGALVAAHATRHLDASARELFRPHDEWGPLQWHADVVVEGLKPSRIAWVLPVVAAMVSWRRHSWRPLGYALLIGGTTAVLTLLSKVLVQRPDTHGKVSLLGGSYPSGHTVTILVVFGGSLLVLTPRTRWWQWLLVGGLGTLMGYCLLVEAAHWFTDVVGALLLATAVLSTASTLRLRQPTGRRGDPGPSGHSSSADSRRNWSASSSS